MKRLWIVALSLAVGGLGSYYYGTRGNAAMEGDLGNFMAWPPSAATLRQKLAALPQKGGAPGALDESRKQLLGNLLTSRFRGHDPKIAVRVKFDHSGPQHKEMIKLMCPARMEPWNIDWLAANTWRETRADMGRSFDMDIFITYIGLSQIKVAELRPEPGNPDKFEIRYKSPDEVRHAMGGDVAATHAPGLGR
jgi:hypothetical protein